MLSACGSPSTPLPLFQAEGKVTFNGEPLEGAKIFFVPVKPFEVEGKTKIPMPNATTDEEGVFVVSTYKVGDGLPEGMYRVKITCENRDKPVLDSKGKPVRGEYEELLPVAYLSEIQSGIQVTVEPGKNEFQDFALVK